MKTDHDSNLFVKKKSNFGRSVPLLNSKILSGDFKVPNASTLVKKSKYDSKLF